MYKTIALDSNGKMLIENGTWKLVESPNQEAMLIMRSNTAVFTQSPVIGVNLTGYLAGPFDVNRRNKLLRVIKQQMELDGLVVLRLALPNLSKIQLNVERR